MEQFTVASSSWSSFPVINGGATSQWLLKMLHPQARAPISALRGPRSRIRVPLPPQGTQAEHPGSGRCYPGWADSLEDAWLPWVLPTRS
jgi:hypothetical protein